MHQPGSPSQGLAELGCSDSVKLRSLGLRRCSACGSVSILNSLLTFTGKPGGFAFLFCFNLKTNQ